MNDAQLIKRAAGGDRGAFESLYDRHWKAVYNYAWLLTRSVADAEDITQESFLALIRKPAAFDPSRAQLRTWLIAVVKRQYLGRWRGLQRESDLEEFDDSAQLLDGATNIVDELIRMERAEAVREAMASLPKAQQEALYLFEFEGLSLSQVAEILNIEANAVKARLFRARAQLKVLLAPQESER